MVIVTMRRVDMRSAFYIGEDDGACSLSWRSKRCRCFFRVAFDKVIAHGLFRSESRYETCCEAETTLASGPDVD